ncbi:MAG: serine/threonine protein kinase [Merismopedia sp. SIO2A8]|nr:serine/threonine protein kinase [Symploca sp. SIO2B6]NET52638.1 serine/threonine protein kinase [Merismopedia sp. SIO2A8]
MAGQILGDRYQVEKQLGKKSGRWTLLARDLVDDRAVILKLISMDEELHPDMLRLFEREINTLKSLEHPDLPTYLDYFEIDLPKDQKALVLVQTYIEGVSTDKYLSNGRTFTESETRRVAKSILKLLVYLHNHTPPVVHRDIKPSNILLAQSSPDSETNTRVCLVDFGSVQELAAQPTKTTILTLVGNEDYMAPEQLGGRAVKGSDLYSLGLTLLTLLTGLHPSDFPRSGSKLDLISIPILSEPFSQWLKEMTEVNVEQRFPSAQSSLDALRAIPKFG